MQIDGPLNKEAILTITYEFNAPRELVFDAFSTAEAMAAWWGPKGYSLKVLTFDFRPRGMFHFKMESASQVMWARFIYAQIERPRLIEFTLSFSDEERGITRAPFFESWPLEIFNKFSFIENGTKTTIVLTSYPINATDKEIASFVKNQSSFREGITLNFNELEVLLSRKRES